MIDPRITTVVGVVPVGEEPGGAVATPELQDALKPRRWSARDRHHAWRPLVGFLWPLSVSMLWMLSGLYVVGILVLLFLWAIVGVWGPVRLWRAVSRRELVVDASALTLQQDDHVLARVELAQMSRVELRRSARRPEWSREGPEFCHVTLVPRYRWVRPVDLEVFAYSERDYDALGDFVDSFIQPVVLSAEESEPSAMPWELGDLPAPTGSARTVEIRSAYLSRWWWKSVADAFGLIVFLALMASVLTEGWSVDAPWLGRIVMVTGVCALVTATVCGVQAVRLRRGPCRLHLEADDEELRGLREGAVEWSVPWSQLAYLNVAGRYRWYGNFTYPAADRLPLLQMVLLDPDVGPCEVRVYAYGEEAQALDRCLNERLNEWRRRACASDPRRLGALQTEQAYDPGRAVADWATPDPTTGGPGGP